MRWVDGGALAEAESNHRGGGGAMEKRTERGRRKKQRETARLAVTSVAPDQSVVCFRNDGESSPVGGLPGGQFHSKLDLYDRESDALCNTNKRKTKKIGESGLRSRYLPQLSFLQGYC